MSDCLITEDGEKEGAAEGDEKKKKRQTRGGKGMIKTKKEAEKERKVTMSRAPRGKKKYVTVVSGLGTFGKFRDLLAVVLAAC